MSSIGFKKLFQKNPPTRGLRYKKTLHQLMQKNSFRNPSFKKNKSKYQIFNILWNHNMTNYRVKEIIPKTDIFIIR